MTGKEALKEYREIYVDKTFKGKCCPTQDWYLEIIKKDLEEIEIENVYLKAQLEFSGLLEYETKKELTKYKRVFEILKDEFGLEIKECCDKYKKAFKKDYQITSYSHRVFVTKDVAELLEELMK